MVNSSRRHGTRSSNRSRRSGRKHSHEMSADLGVALERDMDTRSGAKAMGLFDIPDADTDTMSDLNARLGAEAEGVDSLSGDESTGDARRTASYETITDTNTLMSPSMISGVYSILGRMRKRRARLAPGGGVDADDTRQRGVNSEMAARDGSIHERFETDRIDQVGEVGGGESNAFDESLGLRDVSDEETVRGYTQAEDERRARRVPPKSA